MLHPQGKEFEIRDSDVFLDAIESRPFISVVPSPRIGVYRTADRRDAGKGKQLLAGSSRRNPLLTRSVVFTDNQMKELEAPGEPTGGLQDLI